MTTTTTFVTSEAPQLKENEWSYWDLSFFSFVGRDTMDFLNVECPVIDQAKLDTLRAAGKENVIRTYEKEFETKKKEWQSKQNLIHKYLVETCASDDGARLVAMEHKTKGPAEFYKKLKLWKQHPQKGAEILNNKDYVDKQVMDIILEHEEIPNGTGFPRSLTQQKMDAVSVVVSLANCFDHYSQKFKNDKATAQKEFTKDYLGKFDLKYIEIVGRFIKEFS
jgi:hypothetical protein